MLRIDEPKKDNEKAKQVILYILDRIGQTDKEKLMKLLYFIDMDYYELYEEQFMGLSYKKELD